MYLWKVEQKAGEDMERHACPEDSQSGEMRWKSHWRRCRYFVGELGYVRGMKVVEERRRQAAGGEGWNSFGRVC